MSIESEQQYIKAKARLGSIYGSHAAEQAINYKITPVNKICQIFNEELFNIRKDLVKTGNGDIFTQEVLKGCEVEDWYITSDGEIYVKFKNGDVLRGEF